MRLEPAEAEFVAFLEKWIRHETCYPGIVFSLDATNPTVTEVVAQWKQLDDLTWQDALSRLSDLFPDTNRMYLFRCVVAHVYGEDTEFDSALAIRHPSIFPIEDLEALRYALNLFGRDYSSDRSNQQKVVQKFVAAIHEYLENSDVPSQDLVPLQHLRDALDDLVRGRECHFFDPPEHKGGRKKKSTLDQRVFVLASVLITLNIKRKIGKTKAAKAVANTMETLSLPFPTAQKIKSKSNTDKEREPWRRLLDWRDGLLQGKHGVSALRLHERELQDLESNFGDHAHDMAITRLSAQAGPGRGP